MGPINLNDFILPAIINLVKFQEKIEYFQFRMAFQYNGGSIVGMSGDNCVCIASDNRYGQQLHTISTDFPKIFKITDRIFIGLSGLATDIQVESPYVILFLKPEFRQF